MTSIDTNVVLSALDPRDTNHVAATALLDETIQAEAVVLAPVVYSELMASNQRDVIRLFLEYVGVTVLWAMPPELWLRAGVAFGDYARDRHRGHLPRRLVADFLVAAHADYHQLHVLTFDRTVYDAAFPRLLVKP